MPDRPSIQTFLFADLAGFTALTEAMGDEEAADLAGRFAEMAEQSLSEYEAETIKTIGDALMIRAGQADAAVRLALHLVHDVGGQHYFPIVRVGMDTGEAVARGSDWFGATVNVAARVSGLAGGGEVLLTEATHQAAGSMDGVEVREHGRHELRNVAEPVPLFSATREGERSDAGLPIDPVCRMAVDPEACAGTLVHNGTEFHFCSLTCAGKFAGDPERYASAGT